MSKMSLGLTIHTDGAFDIEAEFSALRRAYPALDYESVRPLAVAVIRTRGREAVRYRLTGGRELTLRFSIRRGAIGVAAELRGVREAPHWLHPVAEARVEGASRCFRTGIGFSGPTGFVDMASRTAELGVDSWLFTGLVAGDGRCLVVSARETGDYMQKSHVGNQLRRHNFRAREVCRNEWRFESGFATERVPVRAGVLRLPVLWFSAAGDVWTALREAAEATGRAMRARVPEPRYHYASWYNRAEHFNEADLRTVLAGFPATQEPLHYVEIDNIPDAWGDWLEPCRNFPDGIEAGVRAIAAAGHVPGVFLCPYMAGSRSRVAREHPDWLLRWRDGSLVRKPQLLNGEDEVYVLDTSHPLASAHLEGVFRTLRGWGVRAFKTDFMEWGFLDSTLVMRHVPGKTSAQYYRDDLARIRRAIGNDSHWLACISYFAPCIGMVDGMRVSSDVSPRWNEKAGVVNPDGTGGGIQNSIEETYACQFFNNVLWQNDPDNTFLRDYAIHMSERDIRAVALWNGILGVSINTSDDFGRLPPARRRLWRFLRPQARPWTAALPYFGGGSAFRVAVREYRAGRSWAVAILNDGIGAATERLRVRDWIGRKRAFLFAWGPEGARPLGARDEWVAEMPGHDLQLLYLSSDGCPPPRGLTLGGWGQRAGELA